MSAAVAGLTLSQDVSRNSLFALFVFDAIPIGANLLVGGKKRVIN